jgi:molecular chaperone GrpE
MPEHPVNDSELQKPSGNTVAAENPTSPSDDSEGVSTREADAPTGLREERDRLQDRLLRTAAEFDNYRKRIERERRELSEYAAADIVADMLPILDDLERALNAAAGPDAEAYRKGVELIHKQMLDLIRKRGVKPIEAVGKDFDPNVHQAVIHEASTEHREGEIIEELRRGYMLGDRLLRPAMVKVAKTS